MPKKKKEEKIVVDYSKATPLMLILLLFISTIAILIILQKSYWGNEENFIKNFPYKIKQDNFKGDQIKKFESEEQFKSYLAYAAENYSYRGFGSRDMMLQESFSGDIALKTDSPSSAPAERYSQTNVQVMGIDEPDIVKTDGQTIYFSQNNYYGYPIDDLLPRPMPEPSIMFDDIMVDSGRVMPYRQGKTNIINAWPPAEMSLTGDIKQGGQLLLYQNTLIVFADNNYIYGYDVSQVADPQEKWHWKINENSYLVAARLAEGKIYLITSTYNQINQPCPFYPLDSKEEKLTVACTDIYYPVAPSASEATYTAISLEANSGQLNNSISFLASNYNSIVYMSAENLYLSYFGQIPNFDWMYDFLTGYVNDFLPSDVKAKISRLKNYDLSHRAKEIELDDIMSKWQNSLDRDQRLKLENELLNRLLKYQEDNKRKFDYTGIVKISLAEMKLSANGRVPGRLLNQFALDEYQGNLRLASTIGDPFFGPMFFTENNSANDVYILDQNLTLKGKIEDLGLSERIYSARFIGDKAYLVTFREIDPFYILDLSNPNKPKMTGELKIPGYSSYLHPLGQNGILGIGMEDFKLKISYFDVSDSSDPREIDKFILDEYGSETLYNHHAFLIDPKHQIFFLPGWKGAYIFSYQNQKLELIKALSLSNAKRALYFEDFLYVVSDNYIVVLDQNNWEEIRRLVISPQLP